MFICLFLRINEPFDQPLYNSVLNLENEIKKPKKAKVNTRYRNEGLPIDCVT